MNDCSGFRSIGRIIMYIKWGKSYGNLQLMPIIIITLGKGTNQGINNKAIKNKLK